MQHDKVFYSSVLQVLKWLFKFAISVQDAIVKWQVFGGPESNEAVYKEKECLFTASRKISPHKPESNDSVYPMHKEKEEMPLYNKYLIAEKISPHTV